MTTYTATKCFNGEETSHTVESDTAADFAAKLSGVCRMDGWGVRITSVPQAECHELYEEGSDEWGWTAPDGTVYDVSTEATEEWDE